jgi:tetratricopeptide (TPR) repeat protein
MSAADNVAPLTVSNELFLVTSLIDRCPKTMMLRELVVNAIEAAVQTIGRSPSIEIEQRIIGGAPKLCIWNTGPGMSESELDLVCDISSSIGKTVSLDGNFGMGAKVASLGSNTTGLVIRSCKAGRVSQVILGKRAGVYGRLLQRDRETGEMVRVLDVTASCRSGYDLSVDWTEVVLNGNAVDQDTVTEPYDGSPPVSPDWVYEYLVQRFFYLPKGITIQLLPGVGRNVTRTMLTLSARAGEFTQAESVPIPNGRTAHYFYLANAPASDDTGGLAPLRGIAGIVYKGEIYGLRQDHQWALEAPSYGISFGARAVSVFIELPDDEPVRPEAYRQYLRFTGDDQRQVTLLDFAAELQAAMPPWLRRIVNALTPPQADYLAEVRAELEQLVIDLNLMKQAAPTPAPKRNETPAQPAKPGAAPRPPPPPVPQYESPPEIIVLRDETMIGERGLTGRAARFFQTSRQLYVNLRCPAVIRMDLHLRTLFADARDQDRVAQLAREIAEWSITRMVARALLYSISKEKEGWSKDEIARSQSPEAMTIVSDNYEIGLPTARHRLAMNLSPEAEQLEWNSGSQDPALGALQRREIDLLDSERVARRALEIGRAPPGPFLRRLSEIANRRRDLPLALDWARKAVDANPNDPWSQTHLAAVLLASGDVDEAEKAAKLALDVAGETPHSTFYSRMSEVAVRKRDTAAALDWAHKAVEADPASAMPQWQIAGILLGANDLEGADKAARTAVALAGDSPQPFLLRRVSEIAQRRQDRAGALEWAMRAVNADPSDTWSQFHLSGLLLLSDLPGAERAARLAVSLSGTNPPAPFYRRISEIELRLRNLPGALEAARKGVAANENDAWARHQLALVLQRTGDLATAEQEVKRAISTVAEPVPSAFLRMLSEIYSAQQNPEAALDLAHSVVERYPDDAWGHNHLAGLLMTAGDLDGAETSALQAVELSKDRPVGLFLRRVSEILARRKNFPEALKWAKRAVEANPEDAWGHSNLAGVLLALGDLDAAEASAQLALELETGLNTKQIEELLTRIRAKRSQTVNA